MITPQLKLDLNAELIVDNFAGGGGASSGAELALGRHVDIAINHDPEAVAMHQMNHPQTVHLCESVFDVDPIEATAGRPVGLAWFSPDCKHFSKAKGGKPRSKKIRGLAWVVLNWVIKLGPRKPRVIMLENVEEFQTWGPLGSDGAVLGHRKGWYFDCFLGALRRRGYRVEHKELRACDYGAPTIRKRFFLIARCDGQPITWPEPTHGDPKSKEVRQRKLKPWLTAAQCIDWQLPCPSIFERKKPLAEATQRRIAKGIMRYVIEAKKPFIVQTGYGERKGQSPRVPSPDRPLGTVVAGGVKHAVVSPVLTECANASTERVFNPLEPLRTQCSEVKGGHFALVGAFLTKFRTGATGSALDGPVHTITAGSYVKRAAGAGHAMGIVTANLSRQFGQSVGQSVDGPAPTVTAGGLGKTQLVTSNLVKLRGTSSVAAVDAPLHTVSAGGLHHGEVRALLIKYYGNEKEGVNLQDPMHTVTSRDRFGLVTVEGIDYAIADIGLRMLQPGELFKAQGFPENYIYDRGLFIEDGCFLEKRLTKTAQVRMCGNSVCPPLAKALIESNVPELSVLEKKERVVV